MNYFLSAALALLLAGFQPLVHADPSRSQIHEKAEDVQPLLSGMKAPVFKVLNAEGAAVEFDPDSVESPLIITFFRGGWCPYCNLHLSELRKAESELTELGFKLWFISMDRPELLYQSLEDPEIGYTVLSDVELEATRAFGLAFRVDDGTVEKYKGYGIDLDAVSGEDHHVLPVPATFLVGTDGIIHFQYTNPDYKVRLHPSVLLAAARAYQADEDSRLARELKRLRDGS